MKFQRREFLKLGLLHAVAIGTAPQTLPLPGILLKAGPSILQGATDDSTTQFSILYTTNDLEVFVTNSAGQKWQPEAEQKISFPQQPKKILKVFFSNLHPGETFQLHVVHPATKKELDVREFQTLDLNKTTVKFVICSCLKAKLHDPLIWKNMVRHEPEVIFIVGDAVYADGGTGAQGATPQLLWKRFAEARNTLEIYYSKKLIPILAVWDDHDFGQDNGNSSYHYIKESQANFLNFFAQDEKHCRLLNRGPGIAFSYKLRDHLFVMLDDRTYRQPQGSQDRYAQWGQEQEAWMMDQIRANTSPVWLMNGSQFFPVFPAKESVAGKHPVQFAGLIEELRKTPTKVIFVSGDVHYTEISRIEEEMLGYETYELTSSAVHSNNFPGVPEIVPNERRIAGTGQKNYILVDSEVLGKDILFKASCYNIRDVLQFQIDFTV